MGVITSFPLASDISTEVSLWSPTSVAKDLGIRRARLLPHFWMRDLMSNLHKCIYIDDTITADICQLRSVPRGTEARGISQKELARRMGRPSNAINEIVNGKKGITAETALQLEEVMPEIPARFWLNLESDYQLTRALIKRREKVA